MSRWASAWLGWRFNQEKDGEVNAINITRGDIGRKVKMSDGNVLTITGWDEKDEIQPVHLGGSTFRATNGKPILPGLPHITELLVETLMLEAGKFYRTRDGRRAFVSHVLGVSPFPNKIRDDFPVTGYIDGTGYAPVWRLDGSFGNRSHDNDLVAEWVEPKRIKGWVNIFADKGVDYPTGYRVGCATHATKADAQRFAEGMVATVEIDVLEGQGLEGEAR
ncbi:MAG: hypothetical protein R3D70_05955 [Rhizobiaceae bacterium]